MNTRVTISLPEEMLEEIDKICEVEGRDRSEYVRDCIRLKRKIQEQVDDPDGNLKDTLRRVLMRTVIEI